MLPPTTSTSSAATRRRRGACPSVSSIIGVSVICLIGPGNDTSASNVGYPGGHARIQIAVDPSMERPMLPNPLHPAIVHFPIVLAFLLPIFSFGALWAIRRGARFRRAWGIPLALSAALALSSWVAVETGEGQE